MKIYVDEFPVKVKQIYYDDGKIDCVLLEFAENVKLTESISYACNNKRKTAGGFIWHFA